MSDDDCLGPSGQLGNLSQIIAGQRINYSYSREMIFFFWNGMVFLK